MSELTLPRRRFRTLAQELVAALEERIRDGRLAPGDKLPTEAAVMGEYGVSRTVVREAISRLQAAGLVATRHGIGTFVNDRPEEPAFRISPTQLGTLQEVIALLELRIGVETEAAALAAQRRSDAQLAAMRLALDQIGRAIEAGEDAVAADFQFHLEIARATQNSHYGQFMASLGDQIIPRARLGGEESADARSQRLSFLRRVNAEHESILDAISAGDADAARAAMRTHLSNSRERRRRSLVTPEATTPSAV
ncbi:MAG: hypothetical protein RL722_1004 [Pseudomonadota bacterium]|jgi:DNA-binding FadR family transcriptional regulator